MINFPSLLVFLCFSRQATAYRYRPLLGGSDFSGVSRRALSPKSSEPRRLAISNSESEVRKRRRVVTADMQVIAQGGEISDELIRNVTDYSILALRVATCVFLIHHGLDKLGNVDSFSKNVVGKYFGFLPGPSQLWTYLAAATQLPGAALLAVGVLSRPVALSILGTVVFAVMFHLQCDGSQGFPFGVPKAHEYEFENAAVYVLLLGYFAFIGAGKFSIDEQFLGGELQFYKNLANNVRGEEETSKSMQVDTADTAAPLQPDQTSNILQDARELLIAILRIGICALMIHHGIDEFQNVDKFSRLVIEQYFDVLPGPGQFWIYCAAAAHTLGPVLLALGAFSRPAAISMASTMIVAVIYACLHDPGWVHTGVELASLYFFVFLYFTVNGAGKFSVDEQILGGELQFYQTIMTKLRREQDA